MELMRKLRKESIRRNLLLIILFAAIAVAMFCFCNVPAALKSFSPIPIDEVLPESMEGKYVRAEIPIIYGQYAVEEQYNDGKSTGKITGGQYMIDFDEAYYMGLFAHEDTVDAANGLYVDIWNYVSGAIEEQPKSLNVEGTIVAMGEDEQRWYYELAEGDAQLESIMLPYYIDVNRCGWASMLMPVRGAQICVFVSFGILLCSLIILVLSASGHYQKKFRGRLESMGDESTMLQKVEYFYMNTDPIGEIRVNSEFVMFQNGAETVLLRPWEIAWAYQRTTRQRVNGVPTNNRSYACVLCAMDGSKYVLVGKDERQVQEMLLYMQRHLPGTVFGYSEEIERLYKADRSAFQARWEEVYPGCIGRDCL